MNVSTVLTSSLQEYNYIVYVEKVSGNTAMKHKTSNIKIMVDLTGKSFFSHIKKKRGEGVSLADTARTLEVAVRGSVDQDRETSRAQDTANHINEPTGEVHTVQDPEEKVLGHGIKCLGNINFRAI